MKVIGGFLAAPLITLFPLSYLGGTNAFHASFQSLSTGGELSIILAAVTYLVAHTLDFKYFRSRSGIAAWILELLGTILMMTAGILTLIGAKYYLGGGSEFKHAYAASAYGLEGLAVTLFAIGALLNAIRSRSSRSSRS